MKRIIVVSLTVFFCLGCGKEIQRSFDPQEHTFISTSSPKLRVKLSDEFTLVNSSKKMATGKNVLGYDNPSASYNTYSYTFKGTEKNIFYIKIDKTMGIFHWTPSGYLENGLRDEITLNGVKIKTSIEAVKTEKASYLIKIYTANTYANTVAIEMGYFEEISTGLSGKMSSGSSTEKQEIVQAFSSRADAAVQILEIGD